MTAPAPLDFAALLAPIPGDDPAGPPVPYEVRERLKAAREEDDPDDFAPDDPMRPQEMRKADWQGIRGLAIETLTGVSKDLLVAAQLTEALTRLDDFAGLRDGLRLLRELVEQCWDRVNPPIEDGDLERRAAPFFWLDDPDKGARFPTTVRSVPLVSGDGKQYGWLAWRQSQDGHGGVGREDFERALAATPAERSLAVAEQVAACREELRGLTDVLTRVLGPAAPGLTGVQKALDDCHVLAQQILQRKRPAGGEAPPDGEDGGPGGAAPGRAAGSRAEVYRQLAHAADRLQELEPHSPIPYLIRRAVELGAMPFPELIRALVRDATVLKELTRELGIKDATAEEG
jgi:type VI secretion system protein ImpA